MSSYPGNYLAYNQSVAKALNIVISIQGIPGVFDMAPVTPAIKPDRQWLEWDSGVTISQTIEPDQGRGSISTMTLKVLDVGGYMSQLISPGILLDEPLGNKLVTVKMGYVNSVYPNDYYRVFRGYITKTVSGAGWVQLELSDANIKTRQAIMQGGTTPLVQNVLVADTTVIGSNFGSFFQPVIGVNGGTDWALNGDMLDVAIPVPSITPYRLSFPYSTPPSNMVGWTVAGYGIAYATTVTGGNYVYGGYLTISNPFTAYPLSPLYYYFSPPLDLTQTVRAWIYIDSEYMEYGPNGLGGISLGGTVPGNISAGTLNEIDTLGPPEFSVPWEFQFINGLNIPPLTIATDASTYDKIILDQAATGPVTNGTFQWNSTAYVLRSNPLNSRDTGPPANHDAGSPGSPNQITNVIQIQGNPIDLILKMYLSGWGGPFLTGQLFLTLGINVPASISEAGAILFPLNVSDEYGLVAGDQITVSGSAHGNNGAYIIQSIENDPAGNPNALVIVNASFTPEACGGTVLLAFRSQFDTLPLACGLSNTPQDIDVAGLLAARNDWFQPGIYTMQFFLTSVQTGKDFIESEIFLPMGAYSITRQGQLSIAVTAPPLLGQTLVTLDQTNVLRPETIAVTRGMNIRRFYNLVQFNYDLADDGTYGTQLNLLNTISQGLFANTTILPINADGIKTEFNGSYMANQRGLYLLNRFSLAAYQITLDTNWQAASQIETGDIIILNDPGTLQITNLLTGMRGIGTQLFEVIQRTLKPQSGSASLTLLSSLQFTVGQRYATIAPSSIVGVGSGTTSIVITDSYGSEYPGDESQKWAPLVAMGQIPGTTIVVHDKLWTYAYYAPLLMINGPYQLILASSLSYTPIAGDIVDVQSYGIADTPTFNQTAKLFYDFVDPTVKVLTGIDSTSFTVQSGDQTILNVGQAIFIHDTYWAIISPNCVIQSIVGTTVTLETSLGFTPSAGQSIELIGFKDGGNPYLII